MKKKSPQQREQIAKEKTTPVEEPIAEAPEKEPFTPYTVAVRASILNVRREPTVASEITTQLRKDQILIISEERDGWGKLMSGAGWISLEYTERRDQDG
jgi:uncharacterized protein YgiM (DUF1202 family)